MNENNTGAGGDKKQNGDINPFNFLIWGVLITVVLNMLFNSMTSSGKTQIDYSQFLKLLNANCVAQAKIESDQIVIELKEDADEAVVAEIFDVKEETAADEVPQSIDSIIQSERLKAQNAQSETVFYTGIVEDMNRLSDRLSAKDVEFTRPLQQSNAVIDFVMSWIFPLAVFYIFYYFIMRKFFGRMGMGGMMNVGKSKATLYNVEKNTGILFDDVAGQDEAKESLYEMVDFLHSPEKYQKIGAKQPKGALLVGPPGTGKTLLAKAVAGEAKVPFFSLSGSEFVEMFVGVGASRVRDLFEQASKSAPCIVFIDEIDAIGKKRDTQLGGNDEREQTLNQLLAEMDGFDSSKGIVILAATNRPEILDKALLRPGRFDRRIIVEKPDLPGREAILKVHAAKVEMDEKINLHEIALATSGATGADLANMINEGALRAVRMGREWVLQEDLMESVEVVIAGKEKKDRVMNQTEKKLVACHEVGHALASALQKNSQPVQKITIVPRTMGSLGYTMNMPEEERYLMTKDELLAQIVTLLAGRTAEEVALGEVSTGASNDIERATKLARSMVTQYGMSGNFDMMNLESTENQYLDGRRVLTCSDATGLEIDNEVKRIIQSCHEKARELLEGNKDVLLKISDFLVEKETISGELFMSFLKKDEIALAKKEVELEKNEIVDGE